MADKVPTEGQIAAFLEVKWKNFACEVCHSVQWATAAPDPWPVSAIMCVNTDMKTPGAFWPVSVLICGNCANTKLIFLQSVLLWLDSDEGRALQGSSEPYEATGMSNG